ncbi:hypothetical protein J1N35_004097 [Gossypium stocksii]|uniref:Reverse transcriptase n=1 Tax=Gossypium stocksii TaxID=47602 RepID=A0A9D3WC54_9ROSI|nr:hypothetical protein J1N35_004097 [Gossypium stocksii]
MHDFRMMLEDCSLSDLGYVGCWYTWERGKFANTNIRECLDRGVATLNWVNLFPHYQIEHLNYSFSDHCPILLDTMRNKCSIQGSYNKSFRFEAKWCIDSSFEDMLKTWWADTPGHVPDKMKKLGHHIQRWGKIKSHEEKQYRVELEEKLNFLSSQELSDETLMEITNVQMGINLEANKEELFWEQRAWVNWLKNGDRNTSYFHKAAVQRQVRGRISELYDKNGRRISSTDEILRHAIDYFFHLFSASEAESDEHVFGLVEKKITDSMNDSLLQRFTEEEIRSAIKMIAPLNAPGVDGFSAVFFQRYWHIVRADISAYCLGILNGDFEIGDTNKTHIVLDRSLTRL